MLRGRDRVAADPGAVEPAREDNPLDRVRPEEVHQVRHLLDVRLRSYCDEVPPNIPGLEIRLSSVDVLTNEDFLARRNRSHDLYMDADNS